MTDQTEPPKYGIRVTDPSVIQTGRLSAKALTPPTTEETLQKAADEGKHVVLDISEHPELKKLVEDGMKQLRRARIRADILAVLAAIAGLLNLGALLGRMFS